MILVREEIRHGDYHNVRELWVSPDWEGFVALVASSPYPSDVRGSLYASGVCNELLRSGAASFGWADYLIIDGFGRYAPPGVHQR